MDIFWYNIWQVLLDMSPSLLLGLILAGLLHAYLPQNLIQRGLSQPNLQSVWRATLFGVPLPLCSCGVLPAALALRNQGASKGATVAFLISTPQTGVDSLLVSASLLGLPFAIFKVVAAFISGLLGGVLVNTLTPHQPKPIPLGRKQAAVATNRQRLLQAMHYMLFDLLGAIDLWIISGIVMAALITTLIPPAYLAEQSWSQGLWGMMLALAISAPLYVCTTGSVPIAASLIAAGMPLGTALVFLMAGPATNLATMGGVYHALGLQVFAIYLGTVLVTSILFGLSFDFILAGAQAIPAHHNHGVDWLAAIATILITGMLVFLLIRRIWLSSVKLTPVQANDIVLKVAGMTCNHCVGRVKSVLEGCAGVREVRVDLVGGLATVNGEHLDPQILIKTVEQAGYRVSM